MYKTQLFLSPACPPSPTKICSAQFFPILGDDNSSLLVAQDRAKTKFTLYLHCPPCPIPRSYTISSPVSFNFKVIWNPTSPLNLYCFHTLLQVTISLLQMPEIALQWACFCPGCPTVWLQHGGQSFLLKHIWLVTLIPSSLLILLCHVM